MNFTNEGSLIFLTSIFFDANALILFLGYSTSSKAFIIFIKRTLTIEEAFHVVFDETNPG